MKRLSLAALVVAIAVPALAQDAQPTEGDIDATFTWSGVDIATLPAADGASVIVSRVALVLTANRPGLIDRLAGDCLLKGLLQGQEWRATGNCTYVDADGDMLFDEVTDTNDKGHAVLTGGTGKFAGITGEHGYTTTWYSSIRDGQNQGIGVKKGHWKKPAM